MMGECNITQAQILSDYTKLKSQWAEFIIPILKLQMDWKQSINKWDYPIM